MDTKICSICSQLSEYEHGMQTGGREDEQFLTRLPPAEAAQHLAQCQK
ncbi:MAG TPA: hypothetical protein PLJ62_04555 [Thermoflexales bacterium]|nr:hypothetical protein [Thermoflexales bacterium]